MESKKSGKLEATGRVGLRDKGTGDIIAAYPHKAFGTDKEIEDKVKYWFYQRNCEAEQALERYYVDTLSPTEIRNSLEKFVD